MKKMNRELQMLESDAGRLKRRRAKLKSLLESSADEMPQLESVQPETSGKIQEAVQMDHSVQLPKPDFVAQPVSPDNSLEEIKKEPGSPTFFIGNAESDNEVTDWRDFTDTIGEPQVRFCFVSQQKFRWPENMGSILGFFSFSFLCSFSSCTFISEEKWQNYFWRFSYLDDDSIYEKK